MIKEFLYEFYNIIIKILYYLYYNIEIYLKNIIYEIDDLLFKNNTINFCYKIYIFISIILINIIISYIFVSCLIYTIWSLYIILTYYFKNNITMGDSIYFMPFTSMTNIFNVVYIDNISLYTLLLSFLGIILSLYIFINTKRNYGYYILYLFLIICFVFFYLIYNLQLLNKLGFLTNYYIKTLYQNFNYEYLNIGKVCDYTENKKNSINFNSGKCNNPNISLSGVQEYIKGYSIEKIIRDINKDAYEKAITNNDLTTLKSLFKDLKDKNGISYYDKYLTAIITYAILKYFSSNVMYNEISELFSVNNILKSGFLETNVYKMYINPLIYLQQNNIDIFNDRDILNDLREYINELYQKNSDIKSNYKINITLYNLVLQDYDELRSNILNSSIDIFDIINNKLISPFYINIFNFLLGTALIISHLNK